VGENDPLLVVQGKEGEGCVDDGEKIDSDSDASLRRSEMTTIANKHTKVVGSLVDVCGTEDPLVFQRMVD
jgi:hypothetical protein